ncbi:peptide ABC transporter substrate-binding protein [Agromyces luteolus]|nr:ABC transporter substrate-binding protein [Agromyces luteolus]GLK27158.1 peptide ABC transporter substrate-binding protein [Agromyces luteolus]
MKLTPPRLTTAVAAAAVAAIALSGCADDASSSSSDTLTLGTIVQLHTFQASEANFSQESAYLSAVYDTLLQVDADGELAPALVTEWSWDDSKTVVTLELRTDVTFSDGSPFNADVAVANLTRFRDGTSTNASQLADMVSAEADGDSTVVLTLEAPNPAFLTYLTQNAGLQESAEAFDNPDIQTVPVGSGPYLLDTETTVEGSTYYYDKNPDYWNPDQQHYEHLVIKLFSDSTAVLNAIKAGEVDGTPLFTTEDNVPAEAAGYTLSGQQPGWNGLTLADRDGTMSEPLGDVRVRQAINYAFDRQALLDAVAGGQGEVTEQMFPPSSAAYDVSLDSYYDYDPEKAKELLADAGYPDGFTLSMPTARAALGASLYDLVADQLADVGIAVEETEVPIGDFFTALLTPKFPAYYMQLQKDPADWQLAQFILTPNATWNPFHSTDPTVADYLQKIQLGNQDEADQAAADLNRYLVEQAWFAPFYAPGYRYASSPDIEIITMEGGGGAMPALWNILPAGG